MKNRALCILPTLFLFFLCSNSQAQIEPTTSGYNCNASQTISPCQTYVYYQARSPDYLDLASIADLFSCSCNSINTSMSISYAGLHYTINKGDTFYLVSSIQFQNLTDYQSVQVVNPSLIPTNLDIGVNVIFPIFCKCPNKSQLDNQTSYLISYVFQPSDNLSSIATKFGSDTQSIIDVNGNNIKIFDTVFVPVSRLPNITQPVVAAVLPKKTERKGKVRGLSIGLAVCGILLILVCGLWGYREMLIKKNRGKYKNAEKSKMGKKKKAVEVNLMADVSDCLDKYRVFGIDELVEATDRFDDKWIIQGSVYKGSINGESYAIKKMKWNACEELKILQKVNHGNLVKLEGFCIDPEDANCYLIYEYFENGSLHSWLHGSRSKDLSWKMRLKIAIDVANGLQYVHEHTRPRVVHKDIKSSNILLDGNMRGKIANFGLAKSGCNAITMHIVGTQGYIAPEYLTDGVVSTKMDVFSFGVVLLELVSGREAINEEGKVLWSTIDGILERKSGKTERLREWMDESLGIEDSYTMDSVVNVVSVAIACLHRDPTRRPTMVDIVYALCKSDDLFSDLSQDGLSSRLVVAR
ncbi:serine/threonine receptor-like kinase NFP [Heracleum sosnowskyi]|uniref:Serine/threonine receptor-like kinase NFP n=1 Tax=Heracleum sosnowskyi TaxID=360622 RepID=A0AAD8N431_9APIA|nr:serine/threonine receptor-like kinase NFP [Heracleum sosnowskyi]